jgi:N-acetylglucosaminyldiphosphoundecaprenol N-acetyl-beta-D-mannosaminyltransferase
VTSPPVVVDVLGVSVSPINMAEAVTKIAGWIEARERHYVCVTGVHGVMEAYDDPTFREVLNGAGLVTPDGMPLVWACRHAGRTTTTRVYGPDLMLAVCEFAAARGWSSFFYGSRDEVTAALSRRLAELYPGLVVAGRYSPPFRPLEAEEEAQVVEMINRSRASIVWIGLSTPKQERWMARMRPQLDAPILIGVGAAFDIHAGFLRQAPPWMQRHGLEWLFRVAMEPRRLWKRYLRNNPRFVVHMLRRRPTVRPS